MRLGLLAVASALPIFGACGYAPPCATFDYAPIAVLVTVTSIEGSLATVRVDRNYKGWPHRSAAWRMSSVVRSQRWAEPGAQVLLFAGEESGVLHDIVCSSFPRSPEELADLDDPGWRNPARQSGRRWCQLIQWVDREKLKLRQRLSVWFDRTTMTP